MTILLECHVEWVKGPWYGIERWRKYSAIKTYGLIFLSAVPVFFAAGVQAKWKRRKNLLLLLPMLGTMAGKFTYAYLHSPDGIHFGFIPAAVEDRQATSYYIDAVALSGFHGWLRQFADIMPMLNLHSQTKAPGMILYYLAFIKIFGDCKLAAMSAGICLGVISTFSIPACYWFLCVLLQDREAAFLGSCFLSLCPGFVLFFPGADPAYIILSCVWGACWILALQKNSIAWSIASGLVVAVILLISFNVLMFGIFLAGFSFLVSDRSYTTLFKLVSVALASCCVVSGLLWISSGYDPISTFVSAWHNQHALLAQHSSERPYPNTAWGDLLTFALGSGWISYLLAGFCIAASIKAGWANREARIPLLAVLQLICVAVTALLASETERVWNFMLPLLMAPIGLEVSRWPLARRIAVLLCLTLLLAAECRNLSMFL